MLIVVSLDLMKAFLRNSVVRVSAGERLVEFNIDSRAIFFQVDSCYGMNTITI